jgi:hypothetical protein
MKKIKFIVLELICMDNLELELIQLINIMLKNQEIFLILTMAKTKLSWLHAVPTFLFATQN